MADERIDGRIHNHFESSMGAIGAPEQIIG
jgi:hypothetical protein